MSGTPANNVRKDRKLAATRQLRLDLIGQALAAVPDDNVIPGVLAVLRDLKVTYSEFVVLDGRDNHSRVPSWHWKLRTARNSASRPSVFDVLSEKV